MLVSAGRGSRQGGGVLVSAGKNRQEAVEEGAAWTAAGMSRSCPWRSSSPGRMRRRVGTSLVLSRTGCRPQWLEPGDRGGRVGVAVGVRISSKSGRGDRLTHTSLKALGCLVEGGLGVGRGPLVGSPCCVLVTEATGTLKATEAFSLLAED